MLWYDWRLHMGIHLRNIFDFRMNCKNHQTVHSKTMRLNLSAPADLRLLHCPPSRIFPDVPWYFLEPYLATCVSPRTHESSGQRALEYTIVELAPRQKPGFYALLSFRRDEICVALKKYMWKACSEVRTIDRSVSRRLWYIYILTTWTIQFYWGCVRIVG